MLPKKKCRPFFLLCVLWTLATASLIFAQKNKYLIIIDGQYSQNAKLQEFISFREERFDVTLKTISEAGGTYSAIRAEIQNIYNNDGLDYVLMIGGPAGGIPYKTGSYNTFHDYGLIDSDTRLDLPVGCWFVSNSTDLENIIHKTMHTEKNIADYPKITTQFTSYTTRPHIEEQCKAIKDEYWDQSDYTVSWMIPKYSGGSSMQYVQDLKDQINNNETSIIAFQAHGGETGWVDGGSYYYAANEEVPRHRGYSIDISDVNAFTNDKVYPIIMSFACVTGSFQKNNGFGENWLTAKGGASAFIGSSKNSSHYQKTLNASLASAFCHENIKTLGDLFIAGKNWLRDSTDHFEDVMSTSSSGSISIIISDEQMYNLYGDPAMRIKPAPVSIFSNTISKLKNSSINIKNISNNNINLTVSKAGSYSVQLLSLKGNVVASLANKNYLHTGDNSINFNNISPAKGLYLLKISGEGQSFIDKVSLVK